MAKPGFSKKKKATSVHSRAARRATSPSINTDKSLKELQPPARSSTSQPSVLAIHQGAGVTKKSKKGRKAALSSKARKRREKDLDRAEAILERTARKVAKSANQLKAIKSRGKPWDEVNSSLPTLGEKKDKIAGDSVFAALDDHWETDEEMDGAEAQQELDQQRPGAKEVVTSQIITVPKLVSAPADDDDDEIL